MRKWMMMLLATQLLWMGTVYSGELGNYKSYTEEGRSIIMQTTEGSSLRLTPYGDYMLRVQVAQKGQAFTPDTRYAMVMNHDWPGRITVKDTGKELAICSPAPDGYELKIQKTPFKLIWFKKGEETPLLEEKGGVVRETQKGAKSTYSTRMISLDYIHDATEHFAGSGAPDRDETRPLDLKGQTIDNNYPAHGQMFIPFFVSSCGYGIFINSSYPTRFNFGTGGDYRLSLMNQTDTDFAMDYFYISGPQPMDVVKRYTDLTGKPRLFQRAFFGLQLSDRGGHAHYGQFNTVESRWKDSVQTLRDEGFPLDGVIFDNLWRAGGGSMRDSRFEWNREQIPDPAEFGNWLKKEGLVVSLDLNRQNNHLCKGWDPEFNIPGTLQQRTPEGTWIEGTDTHMNMPESCPDYTSPKVRDWSWNLIRSEGFGPAGTWPMDALWLDGTDHIQTDPFAVMNNGWVWEEVKNYYTFLIAKTFVQDGWDQTVGDKKRPFVWMRSASPGAQRYTIHWSGDTWPTLQALEQQVVNLQSSGICGYSYFNHDAGGFQQTGPSEELYRQWACAFSSFTPIWRPHGLGPKNSRRPDAWSDATQKDFMEYAHVRYEMIPYIYTYAHESTETGTPMARAMFLAYPGEKAWNFPNQFMWGNEMLVAPNVKQETKKTVWLPEGTWFDFWTKSKIEGDQTFEKEVPLGRIPVYVKAGSIIPKAPYCLSTAFIPKDEMMIDLYLGADGEFTLIEDDNVTEKFRQGEMQKTRMELNDKTRTFIIHPATGSYAEAPAAKSYTLTLYGLDAPKALKANGKNIDGTWDENRKCLTLILANQDLSQTATVSW